MPSQKEYREQLKKLILEHRRLDNLIHKLCTETPSYSLELARLKKRKLQLRDQISYIQDKVLPDIIA